MSHQDIALRTEASFPWKFKTATRTIGVLSIVDKRHFLFLFNIPIRCLASGATHWLCFLPWKPLMTADIALPAMEGYFRHF